MGQALDRITPQLREFIESQRMFFVATAPLSQQGHINLSPKGLETFRVLDEQTVAYLDLTGSGNETSAHVEENGRITFMFCAFDGPPKIVRLYGRGETVLSGTPRFDELRPRFGDFPEARQIIVATITRVATSCGFAVPRYQYVEQRDELLQYSRKQTEAATKDYWRRKNVRSIDGIVTTLGKVVENP